MKADPLPLALSLPLEPGGPVRIIEADAGSGKTWTLSALAVRLLLEQRLAPHEILASTFTKNAAAELKQRIRARLLAVSRVLRPAQPNEPHADDDPFVRLWCQQELARDHEHRIATQRHLVKVLLQIDRLQVSTLHAWAARSLDQFGTLVGLPSPLQMLETADQSIEAGWRRWWTELIDDLDDASLVGLSALGLEPQRWFDRVKARMEQALSPLAPAPAMDWRYRLVAWDGGIDRAAIERALQDADGAIGHSIGAKSTVKLNGNKYRPGTLKEMAGALSDLVGGQIPNSDILKKLHDQAAKWRIDALAASPTQREQLRAQPFWCVLDAMLGWFERAQGLVAGLVEEACMTIRTRLDAEHMVSGVLGFDDQMAWMHQACCRHEQRARFVQAVAGSVKAVLIDECQDTDLRQWAMLGALFGGPSRCPIVLVGDPKQAVYRFRGADVHAYVAVRDHGLSDPDGHARTCTVHALAENQRSHAAVIHDINMLMTPPSVWIEPGLSYAGARQGTKPLPPFTDQGGLADGVVGWLTPVDFHGPKTPSPEPLIVARLVREIQRLLDPKQVRLQDRAVSPGDIAILVNSHAQAATLRAHLMHHGLPVRLDRELLSLFALPEAQDLEVMVGALAQPADPSAQAGAAAVLGVEPHDPGFLSTLAQLAQRGPDAVLGLPAWLNRAPRLVREAGDKPAVAQAWRELLEALIAACAGRLVPFEALAWLQQRRQQAGQVTHDRWLEQAPHAIAVLTTFAAKGLEFGFVFIPYAWRAGSTHTVAALRAANANGGAAASVLDIASHRDEEAKRLLKQADTADAVRKLYVSLTRAVVRAYLVLHPSEVIAHLAQVHGIASDAFGPWPIHTEALTGEPVQAWTSASAIAQPEDAPRALLQALPQAPQPAVRLTSFSALTRASSESAEARLARMIEESLATQAASASVDEASSSGSDVLLPAVRREGARGLAFGLAVHDVLERWDFRDPFPVAWAERWPSAPDRAVDPSDIVQWMASLATLPIAAHGSMGLAQWPKDRLLKEWGFTLRLHQVQWAMVMTCLQAHGLAVSTLGLEGPRTGLLRGSADLVLIDETSRFHLVDWKTNFLGETLHDYAPERLEQAMVQGQYHLQWVLYAVALHRWLKHSLQDYDPQAHLGQVHYVFVRGAGLGDGHDLAAGHWRRDLSADLIEEVDAILDAYGPTA